MPYQVLFNKLSFQRVDPLSPTTPIGEPVVVTRGDMVPSWVTSFEINALMNAGMIVGVDERRADIVPAEALPPGDRTPDQPNVLPSDPNGLPPVVNGQGPTRIEDDEDDSGENRGDQGGAGVLTGQNGADQPVRPELSDSKPKWEAYATSRAVGMSQAEAESLTKAKLVAEVEKRERERSASNAPQSTPTTAA